LHNLASPEENVLFCSLFTASAITTIIIAITIVIVITITPPWPSSSIITIITITINNKAATSQSYIFLPYTILQDDCILFKRQGPSCGSAGICKTEFLWHQASFLVSVP
jgi:hypothetical protein